MAIRLALIVVNYNAGNDLMHCLSAATQQKTAADAIYVVDNASSDDSVKQIHEKFPSVEIYQSEKNIGFAAANNLVINALNTSDFDWVVLLNPDAVPDQNWLSELVSVAKSCPPEVTMLASQLRVLDEQNQNLHDATPVLDGAGDAYHVSGLCWRRGHGKNMTSELNFKSPIFAPCAAAAAYRLSAIKQVGVFDEAYFCYNEDVDLGFRLRLIGGQCRYVESAIVHHIGSKITGKNSDFSVYYGHRNLSWTFFKNMPLPLLVLYAPQHLLMSIAVMIYYAKQGRFRIICRAKWDALKALPDIMKQRKKIQTMRCVKASDLRQYMTKGVFSNYRRSQR